MSFALARFRGSDGAAFAGAVVGEDVIPLSGLLPGVQDIADALADWPAAFSSLAEAVPSAGRGAMVPLSGLTVLPPFFPGRCFRAAPTTART